MFLKTSESLNRSFHQKEPTGHEEQNDHFYTAYQGSKLLLNFCEEEAIPVLVVCTCEGAKYVQHAR